MRNCPDLCADVNEMPPRIETPPLTPLRGGSVRLLAAMLAAALALGASGSAALADSPGGSAARKRISVPGADIKGLQVQMIDDALALDIKHAALNVSLTSMIDLDARPDSFRWQSGGRTYFFSRGAIEGIP